jgi:putative lipoic acid-binding regulatory protein
MTSDTPKQPFAPDQEAPKIAFPCPYPVKVMGAAGDGFELKVLKIFQRHAPEVGEEQMVIRPSAKGNYMAVTITIEATGIEQLELLFADLKTLPAVKLVL